MTKRRGKRNKDQKKSGRNSHLRLEKQEEDAGSSGLLDYLSKGLVEKKKKEKNDQSNQRMNLVSLLKGTTL